MRGILQDRPFQTNIFQTCLMLCFIQRASTITVLILEVGVLKELDKIQLPEFYLTSYTYKIEWENALRAATSIDCNEIKKTIKPEKSSFSSQRLKLSTQKKKKKSIKLNRNQ